MVCQALINSESLEWERTQLWALTFRLFRKIIGGVDYKARNSPLPATFSFLIVVVIVLIVCTNREKYLSIHLVQHFDRQLTTLLMRHFYFAYKMPALPCCGMKENIPLTSRNLLYIITYLRS